MSDRTRVIVAGSRSIDDYPRVETIIDASYPHDSPPYRWSCEIVHGGASGVDSCASTFAEKNGLRETVFEADWDGLGKAAGPIRNAEMVEYGDILIAIWDGESRGTRDMINKALNEGLETYVKVVE